MKLIEEAKKYKSAEEFVKTLQKEKWVKDLSNYNPLNEGHSAWGENQAGFNLSKSGKINLTDNRPVKMLPEQRVGVHAKYVNEYDYPTHRNLYSGKGDDLTGYSGLFSFHNGKPELYLYGGTEKALTPEMKKGLASLIGIKGISRNTPVISNDSRKVLFKLGDVVDEGVTRSQLTDIWNKAHDIIL